MKLILLLGNIGAAYDGTRHNIAWHMFEGSGLVWSEQSRFYAYIAQVGTGQNKVMYARPSTFYNESGVALRALMDFYKIDTDEVLIVHDDLMLQFGTVRCRVGGRDAGNNGLKSIAQHVGDNLARIRIGIANDKRAVMGDTAFVLSKFTSEERAKLDELQRHVLELTDGFITGRFDATTIHVG